MLRALAEHMCLLHHMQLQGWRQLHHMEAECWPPKGMMWLVMAEVAVRACQQ